MEWLERNLLFFQPLTEGVTEEAQEQALAELAMLAMYLRQTPSFHLDERVQGFLRFVAEVYNQPPFCERLFRVRSAFLPQVFLAVILRVTGTRIDDYQWRAIQEMIDSDNIHLAAQPIHRLLELRYIFDLGGLGHKIPSYSSLCKKSGLKRPANLVYLTDMDAYLITHALFHCSNFSFNSPQGISKSEVLNVRVVLDSLLAMYVYRRNWDLVGELLLSRHCLGDMGPTFSGLAWRALLDAQWPDGAVPGQYFNAQELERLKGAAKRKYLFETCYHTTLVAALVGAVCPFVETCEGSTIAGNPCR